MRKRTGVIAIITAAVLLAIGAWWITLTAHPATGPQHMTWRRADGAPLQKPFRGCDGDIGLGLAVWRGGVLLACDGEELGAGWAFLDPRTGEAKLRWPLPPGGQIRRTLGVLPGPDPQQLAIVYEANSQGDVLVGIARPDGWAQPPVDLGRLQYQGAAWVAGKLELVVRRRSEADPYGSSFPTEIRTLDGATWQTRNALPRCDRAAECIPPSMVYRAEGHWVFQAFDRTVAEGGAQVTPVVDNMFGLVDLLAHGQLDTPPNLALGEDTPVIDANGALAHSPPPPRSGLHVTHQSGFTIDAAIHRRPQWTADPGYHAIVEQVGDHTITWHTDADDRVRITEAPVGVAGPPAIAPVVRWYKGLANRATLSDDHDGYWMVDADGTSIHLDGALHRLDPLSLRTHLTQRGSLGADIDEPGHVLALGWALFGLPILLAGYAIARLFGRRRGLAVFAGIYLVTGVWALLSVLPLLS